MVGAARHAPKRRLLERWAGYTGRINRGATIQKGQRWIRLLTAGTGQRDMRRRGASEKNQERGRSFFGLHSEAPLARIKVEVPSHPTCQCAAATATDISSLFQAFSSLFTPWICLRPPLSVAPAPPATSGTTSWHPSACLPPPLPCAPADSARASSASALATLGLRSSATTTSPTARRRSARATLSAHLRASLPASTRSETDRQTDR